VAGGTGPLKLAFACFNDILLLRTAKGIPSSVSRVTPISSLLVFIPPPWQCSGRDGTIIPAAKESKGNAREKNRAVLCSALATAINSTPEFSFSEKRKGRFAKAGKNMFPKRNSTGIVFANERHSDKDTSHCLQDARTPSVVSETSSGAKRFLLGGMIDAIV
jgi:hypothetical protein